MNQLEAARERIDELDRQLAALFEERMEQVAQVADYKRAHGLPVLDSAREQHATAALLEQVSPDMAPYVERMHRATVELSREYQRALLGCADDETLTLSEDMGDEPPENANKARSE